VESSFPEVLFCCYWYLEHDSRPLYLRVTSFSSDYVSKILGLQMYTAICLVYSHTCACVCFQIHMSRHRSIEVLSVFLFVSLFVSFFLSLSLSLFFSLSLSLSFFLSFFFFLLTALVWVLLGKLIQISAHSRQSTMTDQITNCIQVTLINSDFHWGCLQDPHWRLWAIYMWWHIGRTILPNINCLWSHKSNFIRLLSTREC
jgi:ABC-type sugar transport system permease subunit